MIEPPRAPHCSLVLAAGTTLLGGCGEIVGLDYTVGAPAPEIGPRCGALEAPHGDGCERVGVPRCEDGFAEDGRGGCTAVRKEDCPAGMISAPNDGQQCRAVTGCFDRFYDQVLPQDPPQRVYVDRNPEPATDGSTPYASIGEALRAAAGEPTTILVAPGEYVEALEIGSDVVIRGSCPEKTVLVAADSAKPAVRVSAGASVGIGTLEIRGGSAGIAASGTTLLLSGLWIRDSAGPGLSLDDGDGPVSVELTGAPVLVEGALGSGVVAYGSRITGPAQLFVRGTRTLDDGREGYGVALHASALVTGDATQTFVPSVLEHSKLVLEDNAGAALLVEGSDARLNRTVISRTRENGLGESYGVLVRPRAFGDLPASLVLQDAVVEQSAGAGIFVDALPARYDEASGDMRVSVTLDRVSIRHAAGTNCMGNGIRVRGGGSDAPAPQSPVAITHSLIEGARESAIHVQGAQVRVERTIVRDTAESACGGMGDGIAVYGDDRTGAWLWLSRSRIDSSARSGIAAFGAHASVDESVIQGCGPAAIAHVERGAVTAVEVRASQCACADSVVACFAQGLELPPALIGSNGCDRFQTGVCSTVCFDDIVQRLFNPGADPVEPLAPVEAVTVWAADDPRIAPARSDSRGCMEWGGLPRNASFVAQGGRGWHEGVDGVPWGHTPLLWRQTTGDKDQVPIRTGTYGAHTAAQVWMGLTESPLDLRKAPTASLLVCEKPTQPAGDIARFECVHRGIAGLRLEPVSGVSRRPMYTSEGGALDDIDAMTRTAIGGFQNAEPGEVVMRVLPPEGSSARVRCTADAYGDGWTNATIEPPDVIRIPSRPGITAVGFAYCALE